MADSGQAMISELNRTLMRFRAETARVTMREVEKRTKIIADAGDEILAMHRESWEQQQATSDRVARAWSNAIRGVDDYQLPNGTTRSLDNSYDHVFTNALGEFVFSNDPMFDPNKNSSQTWERINRVGANR